MLDTLAGRLTWEPTVEGIRVDIPTRYGWTILINFVWLIVWCGAGWLVLNKTHEGHAANQTQLLWLAGWAAGLILMTASILWSLTGRTTLELTSYQLRISRQMVGVQVGSRSYANADVRNLRFVPSMIRGRSSIPSQIYFEENGKTRRFAAALAETEALALFNKMDQTYKFPRGNAVGSF
jgi:hypothetical protein